LFADTTTACGLVTAIASNDELDVGNRLLLSYL